VIVLERKSTGMSPALTREAAEVELPLLRPVGTTDHHVQTPRFQVSQREGVIPELGRSGIVAGIANMSNSIIGAGIIGMSGFVVKLCVVLAYVYS